MKKSIVPLLLAVLATVAIVAPIAEGTGGADRVKALETKVKALQGRVVSLEAAAAGARTEIAGVKEDVVAARQGVSALQAGTATIQSSVATVQSNLASLAACVRYSALPLTQYDGYLYTSNGAVSMTTALDITEAGKAAEVHVAILNPACVSATNALRLSSVHRSSSSAGAR